MNILPDDSNISKETLWTYKDNIEVFNKYNQYVIIQEKKEEIPINIINEKIIKNNANDNDNVNVNVNVNDNVNDNDNDNDNDNINMKKKDKEKNKIESPLDLIIRLTEVNKIMKNDIKGKLIEFISLPEFSKAFGMKKSSEIMNGLTKDSWNQSTSLFISFLLDKNVIYKEKSYIYNKEKINQIITVC